MSMLDALRRCYARGARIRIVDGTVEGAGADTADILHDIGRASRALPILDAARERVGEGAMRDALKAMDEGDFRSWINALREGDHAAAAACAYWFADGCLPPKSKRAVNE